MAPAYMRCLSFLSSDSSEMCVAVAVPLLFNTTMKFDASAFTCSNSRNFAILRSYSHFTPYSRAFDRVPNEIWSSIFHYATIHDHHDDEAHTYPGMFPMTISHVCSRWRQLALCTGSLWTHIVLTFPSTKTQLSRAESWLARSSSYPLDLLLDFRDPDWDWDESSHSFCEGDMRDLLRILLPHVKRWRHFELLTDTWAPIYTFLRYSQHVKSAPKLEKIGLSRCNAYFASKNELFQPSDLKEPIKLFGGIDLPKLKHVELVGVHLDWTGSSLRNLLSLGLKFHAREVMPPLKDFVHMLVSCPNLERLTILGWGPLNISNSSNDDDVVNRLQRSIKLPHLVSFSFGFLDIDYALALLSLFTFPHLQHLTLEDISKCVDHTEILDATPILEWLTSQSTFPCTLHDASTHCTCNCTLRLGRISEVTIRYLRTGYETFRAFFEELSSLKHVSLSKVDSTALHALHPRSEASAPPCPLLRKISYRGSDCQDLVELVVTRAYAKLPIRELVLSGDCPEMNDGTLDLLSTCGADVNVDAEF